MQSTGDERGSDKPLHELLAVFAAPLLAVVTGAIYGVLALAYSEFHAELGVRPADAGVEYGPGLGGAAGIVVLIVGASAVLTAVVGVLSLAQSRVGRRDQAPKRDSEQSRPEPDASGARGDGDQVAPADVVGEANTHRRSRASTLAGLGLVAIAFALILTVLVAVLLIQGANSRADAVKRGQPLEPLRIVGIEVLGIRADLADVEVVRADKAAVATATTASQILADLDHRTDTQKPLFYLGRASSSFVIYDSERQRVLYIPIATAVVQTHNCETKQRDARCTEVLKRTKGT